MCIRKTFYLEVNVIMQVMIVKSFVSPANVMYVLLCVHY